MGDQANSFFAQRNWFSLILWTIGVIFVTSFFRSSLAPSQSTTPQPCNNRGKIEAGKCVCMPGASGKFCEKVDDVNFASLSSSSPSPFPSAPGLSFRVPTTRTSESSPSPSLPSFAPSPSPSSPACSSSADCKNGGECRPEGYCYCKTGFVGAFCEESVPSVTLSQVRERNLLVNPGVDLRLAEQRKLFASECAVIKQDLAKFSMDKPYSPDYPYRFNNDMFTICDSAFYMCMIRKFKPKRIVEIGAGYSTIIASLMKKNYLPEMKLVAIDPAPRADAVALIPEIQFLRKEVQNAPMEVFLELEENDILFIDSSHYVGNHNTDVNLLFLQVLPRLRPGVVVHVHDVYFPYECRTNYFSLIDKWYEWPFLHGYLVFNKGFDVVLSSTYFDCDPEANKILEQTIGTKCNTAGANLWLRRTRVF